MKVAVFMPRLKESPTVCKWKFIRLALRQDVRQISKYSAMPALASRTTPTAPTTNSTSARHSRESQEERGSRGDGEPPRCRQVECRSLTVVGMIFTVRLNCTLANNGGSRPSD